VATGLLIPCELSQRAVEATLDSLGSIQQIVGGDIEQVALPTPAWTLYVHEAAKVHNEAVNLRATVLWRRAWQDSGNDLDPQRFAAETINGDVLVVGPSDDHGNTRNLAATDRDTILELCAKVR